MTVTFAQLSDLHLDGSDATRQRLVRIANELGRYPIPVDAVLVTGDIVQCAGFPEDDTDAKLAEYRFVHETLSPLAPVAWTPGNSDDTVFGSFLREIGIALDGNNMRLDAGDVTFVMADSHVEGAFHGHLDEATMAWLERELGNGSVPVVLAMHHPAVPFGHPVIDGIRLDNPDALDGLLRRHPQVIAVVCGHTHASASTSFAGRLLFVAPGVHSYGQLPWAYVERPENQLLDPMTPPGYALHRIEGESIASFPILLKD